MKAYYALTVVGSLSALRLTGDSDVAVSTREMDPFMIDLDNGSQIADGLSDHRVYNYMI